MKSSGVSALPANPTPENSIDRRATGTATAFGAIIRGRRKALKLRQDQLALATGVGRRFLIELEAGKPSCQLGRSLLVAEALGLTVTDVLAGGGPALAASGAPELPDHDPDDSDLSDREAPDGRPAGIF
jgi:transcriptional regulator with XRE-family HTH domain